MVSVAGSSFVRDGVRLRELDQLVVNVELALIVSVGVAIKVAVADSSWENEIDLEFAEIVPAVSVGESVKAETLSVLVGSSVKEEDMELVLVGYVIRLPGTKGAFPAKASCGSTSASSRNPARKIFNRSSRLILSFLLFFPVRSNFL